MGYDKFIRGEGRIFRIAIRFTEIILEWKPNTSTLRDH